MVTKYINLPGWISISPDILPVGTTNILAVSQMLLDIH
jgi:hypothetical protein